MVRNAVDCYVALARPDGSLFFFNSRWQLTKQTTPVSRNLLLTALPRSGALLELPIAQSDPLGVYSLYVVTVRSLRDPWVTGNWTGFASASFEVR
jgi:hypothetical protein